MLTDIRRANSFLDKKSCPVFVFFVCLVVFLRWSSFYQSVISWDESLYLLVAQAWSEGNPPYTTVWDNKPPGIYVIFLFAISVLGHSVLSIRISACLFVTITCFFLYKIGCLIEQNGKGIGLLAGTFYAVLTLGNGGLAANTEVFYAPFVAIAAYLFFSINSNVEALPSKYHLKLFVIGLLLGIGFEIKQVVSFDFLAFSLILIFRLFLQARSNTKYRLTAFALSILCLGFILPFIFTSIYFWTTGHFDDYIYANFTANKLRTVNLVFSFTPLREAIVYQIKINKFFWLSIPSAAIYLFITKSKPLQERWLVFSLVVWFLVILIGICSVFRGYLYVHYFQQLSPPLCIVTAYVLIRLVFSSSEREQQAKLRQYLILGILLMALLSDTAMFATLKLNAKYTYFTHVKRIKNWNDTPAMIAEYLKPRVNSDDYIYVAEYVPIVYFLVDAKIPTRYAFPSFLLAKPDLPNITSVAPLEELDRILQKKPVYIIKPQSFGDSAQFQENKNFIDKLNQELNKNYQKETSINEFDLYKLSPKS